MYKRGKSWYSDFWYKGQRYVESQGAVSKSVAVEKDRKMRNDVASGEYTALKNNPQFDKAMDDHLKKAKAETQPQTYRRYKQKADHLKAHFGKRRIRDIEGNEVLMMQYIDKRKAEIKARQVKSGRTEDQIRDTTVNRELALLRAMFNQLIRVGKATKNPVKLVTLFDEIEKERILTPEEEKRIIEAIERADSRYSHLKDTMLIALNTGMRLNEILSMEKWWIKLKEGLIIVPRHSQKRSRKDKRVPINSAVMPIIRKLLRQNPESEYLFVSSRTGTRFT